MKRFYLSLVIILVMSVLLVGCDNRAVSSENPSATSVESESSTDTSSVNGENESSENTNSTNESSENMSMIGESLYPDFSEMESGDDDSVQGSGEIFAGDDFSGEFMMTGILQQSPAGKDETSTSDLSIFREKFVSASFSTTNQKYEEFEYSLEQLKTLGLSEESIQILASRDYFPDGAYVLFVTDRNTNKQCKIVAHNINKLYYFSDLGNVFIMERKDVN